MKFEDKVRAMSGKEIVMAMVEGLQNPRMKVNMDSWGHTVNDICFGCAATNTMCHIADVKPIGGDVDGLFDRANLVGTDNIFINGFENAIDALRRGDIFDYNSRASHYGFSLLDEVDGLPVLSTENYKENLQAYIDYANSL